MHSCTAHRTAAGLVGYSEQTDFEALPRVSAFRQGECQYVERLVAKLCLYL